MTKMLFVEDDDVIKAISADGSDQPFGESILPGRSSQYRAVPYAHGCEAPNKSVAIRAITIPNDIAWRLTPAAGFGQLTSNPFRTWMCGHSQSHKSSRRECRRTRSPYNCRNEIVGTTNMSIDVMPSA